MEYLRKLAAILVYVLIGIWQTKKENHKENKD
jgi:hypothetical protein